MNDTVTTPGHSGLDPSTAATLIEIINLLASARDAMSDDMVVRLASAISEGLNMLDRITRNQGIMRLLQVLDREESQSLLVALSEAIRASSHEIATTPPAAGGIGCMLRVARDPGTQEAMQLISMFGKHLSQSMREQHSKGT